MPVPERANVQGVSRMADNDRAVLVSFSRFLSDDELRDLHNFLRHFDPRFKTTVRQ